MKRHISTIILIVLLLAGLSLLLYPSFSNWWNSFHQSQAVASYVDAISNLSNDEYEKIWADAREYNAELAKKPLNFTLSEAETAWYNSLLDVSGNGIMGYVEIPAANVTLPIYHGTEEEVLQIAVGHISGSSLPTGGPSTHCVLSGHRGLPRAKLFTDIDKMVIGDVFMLNVLDEVLTYEVDQIRIVLPYELSSLNIEEGEDYCTLVTCTPYGVNTHRLLVRGHRIETTRTRTIRITADALQIEPTLVAILMALPILMILIMIVVISSGVRRRRNRREKKESKNEK